MTGVILKAVNLSKRFGGVNAVDDASLDVVEGSITGLIGPNGAGKTTMFALMSGFEVPSRGRVAFGGQDITSLSAHERARLGLARTFQIVQPFAGLSVIDNIAVGAYLRHVGRTDAYAAARDVATLVGLANQLDKPAASLPVVGRKRLELARALATGPRVLLLDEVLAGLNPSEIRDMLPVVRTIRDQGVTILMIEHVMQAVMSLCQSIYVLAEGRMIAAGTPAAIAKTPAVIEAYFGHGAAQRWAGVAHA